ncbi:MAG: DNA mismatch repair endonuclease MutL, partial [Planctomycetota bacterium]
MSRIHLLPKAVVERIAAGEVIERPASVVKEALENAVDSSATHVDVEIEEGGKRLIRVSDDGEGLDPDDLPLAFQSHATSKIADIDDLFSVKTMGFRGEALCSIAAVAQVTMISRTPQADSGHSISLEGGETRSLKACPAAPGTVLEVANLLFNVPVRRKFLKSDSTEAAHVADAVSRVALAHPEVSFRLAHNRREILSSPAVTDLRQRIRELFGPDLADGLLETGFDDGYVKLRGFLSTPALARSNTRQQFFFLNRRCIRDRLIQHAVADAYSDYLPRGRFPVVFLYISLPPSEVDVNVHPTKIEVRFRNAGAVHQALRAALRECLSSHDLTPSVAIPPPAPPRVHAAVPPEEARRAREAIERYFETSFAPQPPAPAALQSGASPPGAGAAAQDGPMRSASRIAAPRQPDLPSTVSAPANLLPRTAVQIHDTYIVVETDDGFTVIDQHALHERILYEQMRRDVDKAPLVGQRLLVPLRLELTRAELLAVESNRDLLRSLAFEIDPFGANAVAVYSYPSVLGAADIGAIA